MKNWINTTVAVALGAVFLAGTVQAQPRGDERHDGGRNDRPTPHDVRPAPGQNRAAPAQQRPQVQAPRGPQVQAPRAPQGREQARDHHGDRHDFRRGQRLPNDYRNHQYVVDNWRAHGLKSPGRGQHWVQVGGDYLLVTIATGVIASVLLAN